MDLAGVTIELNDSVIVKVRRGLENHIFVYLLIDPHSLSEHSRFPQWHVKKKKSIPFDRTFEMNVMVNSAISFLSPSIYR